MAADDKSLVSFKILIGGTAIMDTYDVFDIRIVKQVNRIASAKIKLLDGSVSKENFELSSGEEFIPGKVLEIQAGFGLKTQSIYKGIITAQSIQYRKHSGSLLIVECKDKAIKMTNSQNNGVFIKKKDSEILQTLASNHGLSAKIKATQNTFPQIIQYNATDWDFLLSRAEVNGMVVIAADNALKVTSPKTSDSVETLTFGDNVFEFDTKLDANTQFSSVEATAWNYKSQELVNASASAPSVPKQGNLTGTTLSNVTNANPFPLFTTVHLEEGVLKTWADSHLLKSRLAKIRGEIKVFGSATFEPNVIVKLAGMGIRFNGEAYVSGVTHEVSKGNWWSYLTIGIDPEWFSQSIAITARPASGLLPGIKGLQNGTIVQIHDDPDSETRIQVNVPIFKNSGESKVWARWVQPYATAGAGQFFMPEVGDEVALGFLNEDPRFPVILGSLYSSQKAPPYTPAEENPIKAIVTKNQLKIEFNDDKKIITITTPGENKMILSDDAESITIEDQNNNKITMDSGGISMDTPNDLKLSADGEVKISGTGGVKISSSASATLEADASLSISGLEVSISADTTFEASGSAEASLSADGEVSISGAIVMIN